MKLVYVMYHYPSLGGEGCRSIEQLQLLSKLFDVTLISLFDDPAEKLRLPKITESIQLSKEKRKVSLYSSLNPSSLVKSLQGEGDPITSSKIDSKMRELVRREVLAQNPDVVIARNPVIIYALRDLKKQNQFFLGDAVDSMQRFFQSVISYGDFYLKPAAFICKNLAKQSEKQLRGFDTISFITEADKNYFSGSIPTKVLPNIKPKTQLVRVKKKFDPVFFASWSYYPNYHGLKFFTNSILPLLSDYSIALIGNVPKTLKPILEKNKNITLTGYLNDSEFNRTVAASKVSLSPILIGAGQQNKILDALGLGVPVIATPLFADSNPNSPVAIAKNAREFKEKLEHITSLNLNDYTKLSKKSHDFYLSYSENSLELNHNFFTKMKDTGQNRVV